jgi:diguanylate cyclase (GGDEF)-like protein
VAKLLQTSPDNIDQLSARELWRQARTDALTGLANRLAFSEALNAELKPDQHRGALLYLDLDHFKDVNDTLGHSVGDKLLVRVTDRIRSVLPPKSQFARLGGDEFAVLLPGADRASAALLASRIVELAGRTFLVEDHVIHSTISIGAAIAPDDAANGDELMQRADLALYRAKEQGRNAFHFFAPEMDERLRNRRNLEFDLRKALGLREFELHYQPVLNVEAGRIDICEALLRWRHPVRGMVSPGDFIPVAEQLGVIIPIGEWALKTACRETATWPPDIGVAVNLSPVQFKSKRLVAAVKAALAAAKLDPRRLELEITESVLLHDNAATLEVLHELRGLGVKVAMDDFGTGYSSLSYLRSFPFDKIKIDQSFIRGTANRRESTAIVRAIVGLGSTLGMATVAEGVESAEQMEWLRREACSHVQGYHISKPLPADQVRDLMIASAKSKAA